MSALGKLRFLLEQAAERAGRPGVVLYRTLSVIGTVSIVMIWSLLLAMIAALLVGWDAPYAPGVMIVFGFAVLAFVCEQWGDALDRKTWHDAQPPSVRASRCSCRECLEVWK